jgi:hypothetical protein
MLREGGDVIGLKVYASAPFFFLRIQVSHRGGITP